MYVRKWAVILVNILLLLIEYNQRNALVTSTYISMTSREIFEPILQIKCSFWIFSR
jgi:hypothetical protein